MLAKSVMAPSRGCGGKNFYDTLYGSLVYHLSDFVTMSLTLEQVHRIAHLARIEVDEAEARRTLGQLNEIFSLIETMQAVDTQGVEPMAHAQELAQRLRPDCVTENDQLALRAAFQAIAPEAEAGLYLVPKVIE